MMIRRNWLITTLAASCVWSANLLADNSKIVADKTAVPPKIDGILTDDAWNNVPWHSDFTILNIPSKPASAATRFRIVHDAANIYIAIECDEPLMSKIKAYKSKRDDLVWHDDNIEINIDAKRDLTEFFQFIINSKGVLYDAERRQGGAVGSDKWNAEKIRVATQMSNNKYTVEIAIPIIDLCIDSGTLARGMGINICRTRLVEGHQDYSTFVPLSGGFMQPGKFAQLDLKDANLSAFCWQIKKPYELSCGAKSGKINYSGKFFINNETGKLQFAKAVSYFADAPSLTSETVSSVNPGKGREVKFSIPVESFGNRLLIVELLDRKTNNAISRHQFECEVAYSPLSVKFSVPAFRNNIYATEKIDELVFTLDANLETTQMSGAAIEYQLLDSSGRSIASGSTKNVSAIQKLKLPITNLADGKYSLNVQVCKDNKTIAEVKNTLRKLPPAPGKNELRFNENKVALWNGIPSLFYGWFSIDNTGDEAKLAALECYNVTVSYNAHHLYAKGGVIAVNAWLDLTHRNGFKVLMYPYPERAMLDTAALVQPLSEKDLRKIADYVNQFKNHPAIAAWYITDEPEIHGPVLPERLKSICKLIAEIDPYHPTIILNDSIDGVYKYGPIGDISMPDPYPCFLADGLAAQGIEKVGKFMQAVGEINRAAWITPQAFNYGDYKAVNNRAPNLTELRNMQYQAVINGATGFCWYTYYHGRKYPEIYEGIALLGKELKMLKDVALSPQKCQRLSITGGNLLSAAYYPQTNGADYIIVVNCAGAAVNATVTLPPGAPQKWYVVSEDRQVSATNGKISEKMGIYDVNIYSTKAGDANALSISATEKEIEKQQATMKK